MFVCRVGNVLQQLVPDIIIITEYADISDRFILSFNRYKIHIVIKLVFLVLLYISGIIWCLPGIRLPPTLVGYGV
ncbi:hypothetical protein V1477_002484 [Vespula maculifrons]|uniref:Uncharacterized protein n=1 Tax=Vespula maculifrons TaxID=7453 RepID=A0ABD2CWL8_VESMC